MFPVLEFCIIKLYWPNIGWCFNGVVMEDFLFVDTRSFFNRVLTEPSRLFRCSYRTTDLIFREPVFRK